MVVEPKIEIGIFPRVKVLARDPARVSDIPVWKRQGPWASKSKGDLWLTFQFGLDNLLKSFFQYDQSELDTLGRNVRGMREYRVSNIPVDSQGGLHFHRVRQSLVQVPQGAVEFDLEDVFGGKRTVILASTDCMLIPPFTFVIYRALKLRSSFTMLVNTIFTLEHGDVYGREEFRTLQEQFK